MLYLLIKAVLSGVIIAIVSEVAPRWPGWGALIVSLPLVSVLAMIWLCRDRPARVGLAAHAEATFWFVLPTLPMFLLIPLTLRQGASSGASLAAGCALTVLLYLAMTTVGPRFGLRL